MQIVHRNCRKCFELNFSLSLYSFTCICMQAFTYSTPLPRLPLTPPPSSSSSVSFVFTCAASKGAKPPIYRKETTKNKEVRMQRTHTYTLLSSSYTHTHLSIGSCSCRLSSGFIALPSIPPTTSSPDSLFVCLSLSLLLAHSWHVSSFDTFLCPFTCRALKLCRSFGARMECEFFTYLEHFGLLSNLF